MMEFVITDGILGKYCGCATHVAIPTGVRVIGENAFDGNDVESVALPEGVEKILGSAFKNCTSLREVSLPTTLTLIGTGAFSGCRALERITFHEGIATVGPFAFYGCVSLRTVSLPRSIRTVEHFSFCGCKGITELSIPEGVERIARAAFQSCSSLTSVTLPSTLREIGKDAFFWCKRLCELRGSIPFWGRDYPTVLEALGEELLIVVGLSYPSECPWIGERLNSSYRVYRAFDVLLHRGRIDLIPALHALCVWERTVFNELLGRATESGDPEAVARLLEYSPATQEEALLPLPDNEEEVHGDGESRHS